MPGTNDYTVGWICALTCEYVAAQSCLDEEHDDVSVASTTDSNEYTLGRIGKHNIVMASLPEGEYGTTSATSAATNMLRSFPNIRIGLMVGIGGGVPTRHDIRLGDVVVSTPRDGMSGVFQYDFGKTIQDQTFIHTGVLDKPPSPLLSAIRRVEAHYEREGHRIEETVNTILTANPRLRPKYSRPNSASDLLFKSDLTHDNICGREGCVDNHLNLVPRRERTQFEDIPTIHYGTIASGNQLIKDAIIRDKLAREKDILCFEMEAAGLMNHFPCMVIRGICDYSDSHKNDQWQGYASLTAALYAKDLLCHVSPRKIDKQERIADLVFQVGVTVSRTEKAVSNVKSILEKRERIAMLDWFTDFNHGLQLSGYLNRRTPGTGEWFLESVEFKNWLNGTQQTLLCPGIPGSGKTIIASIVADHLHRTFPQGSSVGIAFAFLDHQAPISHAELLRSLLKQFIPSPTPEIVAEFYEYHSQKGTYPSSAELSHLLCGVLQGYSRTFLVIDALDESPVSEGIRSKILTELFKIQDTACTNIFVTSRQITAIVECFEEKGSMIREIRAEDGDVHRFIKSEFLTLGPWIQKVPGLERQITDAVMRATDGMFLLAHLHLSSLRHMTTIRNVLDALGNLPKGFRAYHDAYENLMTRINNQATNHRELAIQVLSWITQSRRPIRIAELQHALANTEDSLGFDEMNVPDIGLIVDVCDGLIIFDQARDAVRLVHETASEYFKQRWTSWFPGAHQYMATVLIRYLSYEQFSIAPSQTQREYDERLQMNCLYEYAASYWGDHARQAYPQVKDLVARFLRCESKLLNTVQVLDSPRFPFSILRIPDRVTGLHIAAYFGLIEQIRELIREKESPNTTDSFGRTALHWAVKNGQRQVAELLVNHGLDTNALDVQLETPMHYSARRGSKALVELLINLGSQVEARNKAGESLLLVAAGSLNLDALGVLLANGADVNASDNMDRNALHLAITASGGKQVESVKLLLSYGVDVALCDRDNMTPFHYAVAKGNTDLIDLLLEAGANINLGVQREYVTGTRRPISTKTGVPAAPTQDVDDAIGLTPLHYAACVGHHKMTEYLLSKGANPNARSHHGDTPLHLALRRGLLEAKSNCRETMTFSALPDGDAWNDDSRYIEVVRDDIWNYDPEEANEIIEYVERERLAVVSALLASPSIDLNVQNIQLDTPLHLVKYDQYNSIVIVSRLLEQGADIFARNQEGRTSLHLACSAGALPIVEELLDRGCSIDTTDYQGLNALHLAVREGQHETVQAIFSRDEKLAEFYCRNKDTVGRTLLHHHLQADFSNTEMIVLLLTYGARMSSTDNKGDTPLSIYLGKSIFFESRTETCRLLLQHGADPLWTSPEGRTLAHLTVRSHKAELGVLEAFSDHGLDLSIKGRSGKGILHHGAIGGSMSMEILTFLYERNLLELHDTDIDGKTPLDYAFAAAKTERSPDLFYGDRWKHTWENLQSFVSMAFP